MHLVNRIQHKESIEDSRRLPILQGCEVLKDLANSKMVDISEVATLIIRGLLRCIKKLGRLIDDIRRRNDVRSCLCLETR